MSLIPLSSGKYAQVDDADFAYLSRWKWSFSRNTSTDYASRNSEGHSVLMHRFILRAKKGQLVDHRDGDGLNNRRANLRLCTRSQNGMNRRMRSDNRTGFKGVRFKADRRLKWIAYIKIHGKERRLGSFTSPELAAEAYDKAAEELFGTFAFTNQSAKLLSTHGSDRLMKEAS
jgi:hypothetical protein